MRTIGFALLTILPWAAASARGDEAFPYTAYVIAEDVYVRSGPGRNYYPTEKMAQDDSVEVYRHDPGGWCAIRPPDGSFSWVSSRFLKPTEAGLGEVLEGQVVARVGSQFSNVRDVIQVRLDQGEIVEILGEHNAGGQTWYKIGAPAGEFRWISQKFLSTTPPHDGVSQPRVQATLFEQPEASATGISQARLEQASASVTLPEEAAGGTRDGRTIRHTRRDRDVSPYRRPAQETFDQAIDAIEREISEMAAEEPTVWTFHELRHRVDGLLDEAATAVERGKAHQLEQKLAQMEDVRERFETVGTILDETDRRVHSAATNGTQQLQSTGPEIDANQNVDASTEFDAKGILRPVISRRLDAPRYALVDITGNVLYFLSPAPGVNLQANLGSRIGVLGSRGYLPELRKPHVMVKRIVPLEETVRR